ncbi:hypothetical protein LK07_33185 [Streptomyces pluripotens]|uniref:Uncharacterized protein n=1 Tax=Streptomyces pluripotens TaxID=1355015 RepID=A0A221P782_9ACTN|nr:MULTISPECIES: hypothetical protein [Streptomyces]ARP73813.1 hypothetical protein LK06_031990 [Streptomyces pluripotens]ASN28060.1 hypothetical protein LK07_33185 [Streptomyces pluripotens]KIE27955.1 hypothetical protein LK08_05880 [Streptomyces sp. MUSC 125]MCH0559403.1 hypothetical protein [Streptomyces sp. MUM 16J]
MDEERTALITRSRHAGPPTPGRADLDRVGSAFKLLEFNVNTGLGGADTSEVHRALMASEPFAGFAAEFGLDYTDTTASRGGLLRRVASYPADRSVPCDGG